jgi:hypothetical protein
MPCSAAGACICAAHRQHRQQIQVLAEIALHGAAELPPLLTVLAFDNLSDLPSWISDALCLTKMLRALIDPNVAPVRAAPREERDLFIVPRCRRDG